MVELFRKCIAIDDDNNPALYNTPRQGETNYGTGNWRREGIIYPRKAGNLQNSFAYSHDAVLHMSLIQLFFIILPEEYLKKVLIPDSNKGLSVPRYLQ